jgi:hypothetical protein
VLRWVSRVASAAGRRRPGPRLRRKHHRETRFRGPPRACRPGILWVGVRGRPFRLRPSWLRPRLGPVSPGLGPLPPGAGAMRPALGEPPQAWGVAVPGAGGNGLEPGATRPSAGPAAPGPGRTARTPGATAPRRGRSQLKATGSPAERPRIRYGGLQIVWSHNEREKSMRKKLAVLSFALALAGFAYVQSPVFANPCRPGTVPCSCDGVSFTCLAPAVCAHILCSQ